jgi:hypothetical protein
MNGFRVSASCRRADSVGKDFVERRDGIGSPVEVIASRIGSREITALKFPPKPM